MKHNLYDPTRALNPVTEELVVVGIYDDEEDTIRWLVPVGEVRAVCAETDVDLRTALNVTGPTAKITRADGRLTFELPRDETAHALDELVYGGEEVRPHFPTSGKTPSRDLEQIGRQVGEELLNGAVETAMKLLTAHGTHTVEVEGRIVDTLGNALAHFSFDTRSLTEGTELVGLSLRNGRFDPMVSVEDDGTIVDNYERALTTTRSESFTLPSNPRRLPWWKRLLGRKV